MPQATKYLDEFEVTTASQTWDLRWGLNGKLQQAWRCSGWPRDNPAKVKIWTEWRDVPSEEDVDMSMPK